MKQFHLQATDQKDEDGKIISYKWEFGDGAVSNEQNPTHVYTKEGAYTAKLTVTDDKGATNTATATVTVQKKEDNSVEKNRITHSKQQTNCS